MGDARVSINSYEIPRLFSGGREGGREIDRQRETDSQTETGRQTETDRQTDTTQTDRQAKTGRQTEAETSERDLTNIPNFVFP